MMGDRKMRGYMYGKRYLMGGRDISHLVQASSRILWGDCSVTGYDSQNRFIYTRFRSRFFVHMSWKIYVWRT